MRSEFEAANLILYYRMVNGLLDLVIWCLGPFADDSRHYGLLRCYLARITCWVCAQVISRRGESHHSA